MPMPHLPPVKQMNLAPQAFGVVVILAHPEELVLAGRVRARLCGEAGLPGIHQYTYVTLAIL
jgi:hypothetical protein